MRYKDIVSSKPKVTPQDYKTIKNPQKRHKFAHLPKYQGYSIYFVRWGPYTKYGSKWTPCTILEI